MKTVIEDNNCNECGGYGSRESFDGYEQAAGVRDTCYHCCGTGICTCHMCNGEVEPTEPPWRPLHSETCATNGEGDCTCGRTQFENEEVKAEEAWERRKEDSDHNPSY